MSEPYVVYRTPTPQPTRSADPRDAFEECQRFIQRVGELHDDKGPNILIYARRWTPETAAMTRERLGDWPAECSAADFEEAVRLAEDCFGAPVQVATEALAADLGLEQQRVWNVPSDRADDVLNYLERVPTCTGGEGDAPVSAHMSYLLRLRDLDTGAVLPRQGMQYFPMMSELSLTLQRHTESELRLTLPFAEPDRAADYAVALQEFAPVWLDPRYFDYYKPTSDSSGFERHRLAPDWIGATRDGRPRLDASRSGLSPRYDILPSQREMAVQGNRWIGYAAFDTNRATVEAALRDHAQAAIVLRGPLEEVTSDLLEQAAQSVGMLVYRIGSNAAINGGSLEDDLEEILVQLADGPAVLVLEDRGFARSEFQTELRSLISTRAFGAQSLPATLRIVLEAQDGPASEATQAAEERYWTAHMDGFATREQRDFLWAQYARAANDDVMVTLEPR